MIFFHFSSITLLPMQINNKVDIINLSLICINRTTINGIYDEDDTLFDFHVQRQRLHILSVYLN